jgi:hypothetical protein
MDCLWALKGNDGGELACEKGQEERQEVGGRVEGVKRNQEEGLQECCKLNGLRRIWHDGAVCYEGAFLWLVGSDETVFFTLHGRAI